MGKPPQGWGALRRLQPGRARPPVSLNPGAWKLLRLAHDLPPEKLGRLRFPRGSEANLWACCACLSATIWAVT